MTTSDFYTKEYLSSYGELVNIGDYTYGCPKIMQWGEGAKLFIGKYCSIADEVKIFLGGNHRVDWITTYPFSKLTDLWPQTNAIVGHPATKGDVRIGSDVWIGYDSVIMSGVSIGDGAVIGARAVVTKNVPPYAVAAGNPARIIKIRFSHRDVKLLLKIQWWNWDNDLVKKYIDLLCSNNIKEIKKVYYEQIISK